MKGLLKLGIVTGLGYFAVKGWRDWMGGGEADDRGRAYHHLVLDGEAEREEAAGGAARAEQAPLERLFAQLVMEHDGFTEARLTRIAD